MSSEKQYDQEEFEEAAELPKEDYTGLPEKIMRGMVKHNISKVLDKTLEQDKDLGLSK